MKKQGSGNEDLPRRTPGRQADSMVDSEAGRAPERTAGPGPEPLSESARARVQAATDFVEFLRQSWGTMAGVSVLFPLVNAILGIIPMGPAAAGGAFRRAPVGLITALAFLGAIFALISAFARRHTAEAARKAWTALGAAGLFWITYLILHGVKLRLFDIWGVAGAHPVHLALEVPMLLLYILGFALMTRAFALFGIAGKGRQYPSDGAASGGWPENDDPDGKEAPE